MPNTIMPQGLSFIKDLDTYATWRDMLALSTISSIKWENMPPTVDTTYLERALYFTGSVIFFVSDGQLVVAKGFGTALPNVYNIPTERVVNAPNGFTANLSNGNSVICYNDVLRRNGVSRANKYARRLAHLDKIITLNTDAQKSPVMLKSSENNKLSIKNAYAMYEADSPMIAITDDFDPNAIQVLDLHTDFKGRDFRELQHDILSEYYASVGIANSNNYKAERLITSEVYSNNAGVLINQAAKLKPRQEACDMINTMFKEYLPKGEVSVRFEVDAIDEMTAINPSAQDLNTYGGMDTD